MSRSFPFKKVVSKSPPPPPTSLLSRRMIGNVNIWFSQSGSSSDLRRGGEECLFHCYGLGPQWFMSSVAGWQLCSGAVINLVWLCVCVCVCVRVCACVRVCGWASPAVWKYGCPLQWDFSVLAAAECPLLPLDLVCSTRPVCGQDISSHRAADTDGSGVV